jgi:hypothetical protein
VQGPNLLVFHHAPEHQAFHMGRTRRTLHIPGPVLHAFLIKWMLHRVVE